MMALKDSNNPIEQEEVIGGAPNSWAFRLALCLLAPIFYFSYVLTILSPLPVLYLRAGAPEYKRGLFWALFSFILGTFLCIAIKGWLAGFGFFLFSALPAIILGEILLRRKGPELAILGALIALFVAVLGSSWFYAHTKQVEIIPFARSFIEKNAQDMAQKVLVQNQDLPDATVEELKQIVKDPSFFLEEAPGLLITLAMLLCILPCLSLIRWNPKGFLKRAGIARDYLRRWKTPDWFVWIALLCGVFLVYEVKILSLIAKNLLKPIVLIYFLQGMSILAFFLDSLRLRGPLRVLFYGAGIFFLTPMVVSFGFFDLWFNFRSRRKAEEDKQP